MPSCAVRGSNFDFFLLMQFFNILRIIIEKLILRKIQFSVVCEKLEHCDRNGENEEKLKLFSRMHTQSENIINPISMI